MKDARSILMVVLAMILALAGSTVVATAETLTANVGILNAPISITKQSDMVVSITGNVGTTTYTDLSSGWDMISPASFSILADGNTPLQITAPATVTLSNGTNTVNVSLTCRADINSAPLNKNAGTACGTQANTSSTGKLYISLIPTQAAFSGFVTGAYTGTVMVSINY